MSTMKFLQIPGYFFFFNGEDKEKQMFHNTKDDLSGEKCVYLSFCVVLFCLFCFLRLVVVLVGL